MDFSNLNLLDVNIRLFDICLIDWLLFLNNNFKKTEIGVGIGRLGLRQVCIIIISIIQTLKQKFDYYFV